MTDAPAADVPDRERRLYEALGDYFAAVEAGLDPDRSALIARHPDLADSLAEFFSGQDRFHLAVGPLRPSWATTTTGRPPTRRTPTAPGGWPRVGPRQAPGPRSGPTASGRPGWPSATPTRPTARPDCPAPAPCQASPTTAGRPAINSWARSPEGAWGP